MLNPSPSQVQTRCFDNLQIISHNKFNENNLKRKRIPTEPECNRYAGNQPRVKHK